MAEILSTIFPWVEALHVLGFSLWIGSIFILDLKLLGLTKRAPFYHYHMVPWAYAGLALTLVTGLIFVIGNPAYLANPAWQLKMVFMVLAVVVAMLLHTKIVATHLNTAQDTPTPTIAKIAGGASLLLWLLVLICARLIPYQYEGLSSF